MDQNDDVAHIKLPPANIQKIIQDLHDTASKTAYAPDNNEDFDGAPGWLRSAESGQWVPPPPEAIIAICDGAGWSSEQVGRMLSVDGRQVRNWKSGNSRMPYAAWRYLLIKAGILRITRGSFSFRWC